MFLSHYSFGDAAESSPSLGQAKLETILNYGLCCLGDQEHNTEEHETSWFIQMGN